MSSPQFHRKTVYKEAAEAEIKSLKIADSLDPNQLYHIGDPIIEGSIDDRITIKFNYGGKPLYLLYKEPPEMIKKVLKNFINVLEGIRIFNSNNFYHRDIKITNIIYNDNCDVKIIDFGISGKIERDNIFENIYPMWPFESIFLVKNMDNLDLMASLGEYTNHDFMNPIMKYFNIYDSDIKFNAILMKKKPNSLDLIYKKLDVYSIGIILSNFVQNKYLRDVLSPSQNAKMYKLCKDMINPYTNERITIEKALEKYSEIFQ